MHKSLHSTGLPAAHLYWIPSSCIKGSVIDWAAHDSESSGSVGERERGLGLFRAAAPCHNNSTKSEINAAPIIGRDFEQSIGLTLSTHMIELVPSLCLVVWNLAISTRHERFTISHRLESQLYSMVLSAGVPTGFQQYQQVDIGG